MQRSRLFAAFPPPDHPEVVPVLHPGSSRAAPARRLVVIVVALTFTAAGACTTHDTTAPDPRAPTGPNALVVRVIDGDTVVVSVGGTEESARLIGIDTPETKRPDTPVECFGHEASDRLTALLPPGTPVRLELDQEPRDRYGRLLVYLTRSSDAALVNETMVQEGFADVLSIAPNDALQSRFAAAVATARADRLGLWGACPDAHSPLSGS